MSFFVELAGRLRWIGRREGSSLQGWSGNSKESSNISTAEYYANCVIIKKKKKEKKIYLLVVPTPIFTVNNAHIDWCLISQNKILYSSF